MKVCNICEDEISTRDGVNVCAKCEETETSRAKRQCRANQRKAKEDVLRSIGLKKVRGALGGIYWE